MKNPRVWLGILVSVGMVAWLAYTLDPVHVWQALSGANPLLVVLTCATLPVTMYLKSYRWRYFFPAPERVSMHGLLSSLYLGYMANTVLPLRAGEILRAYLVGESDRVSKPTVLATVLIEKVFDLGTIALFLFGLRFAIPLPDWADAAAVASGFGLLLAMAGLATTLVARPWALLLARRLEARVPLLARLGVAALLTSFLDGLAFLRDPRTLALVLVWTMVLWAGSLLTIFLGLSALGISAGLWVAAFVLVVTNLGMAIPSAPGYVGVFHSAVVVSLAPYGVDAGQALAAAIVLHAAIFGSFIGGGLYFLVRGQSTDGSRSGLADLLARARTSAHDPAAH